MNWISMKFVNLWQVVSCFLGFIRTEEYLLQTNNARQKSHDNLIVLWLFVLLKASGLSL